MPAPTVFPRSLFLRKICHDWYIQNCSVILRWARKDEARGRERKILGLSRKSLRSRKRQDSESTDWIYILLQLSKAVTLYVYRWIGLQRALCNSDRTEANKSTAKFFREDTLSLVLLNGTTRPRTKFTVSSLGRSIQFLYPTIIILLNTSVVVHRLN